MDAENLEVGFSIIEQCKGRIKSFGGQRQNFERDNLYFDADVLGNAINQWAEAENADVLSVSMSVLEGCYQALVAYRPKPISPEDDNVN